LLTSILSNNSSLGSKGKALSGVILIVQPDICYTYSDFRCIYKLWWF